MIIRIIMKTPDCVQRAIDEALLYAERPAQMTEDEWLDEENRRMAAVAEKFLETNKGIGGIIEEVNENQPRSAWR